MRIHVMTYSEGATLEHHEVRDTRCGRRVPEAFTVCCFPDEMMRAQCKPCLRDFIREYCADAKITAHYADVAAARLKVLL